MNTVMSYSQKMSTEKYPEADSSQKVYDFIYFRNGDHLEFSSQEVGPTMNYIDLNHTSFSLEEPKEQILSQDSHQLDSFLLLTHSFIDEVISNNYIASKYLIYSIKITHFFCNQPQIDKFNNH